MTSVLDILQDYCNLRMLEFSRLDGSMKVDDRKVEVCGEWKNNAGFIIRNMKSACILFFH